jgi:hypothetical protein
MLTAFEMHALEALRDTDYKKGSRPSAVGHVLWEKSDPETRHRHPSQQGLALFGGRFLAALCKAKLASHYHGYHITREGLAVLAEADRTAANGAAVRKDGAA